MSGVLPAFSARRHHHTIRRQGSFLSRHEVVRHLLPASIESSLPFHVLLSTSSPSSFSSSSFSIFSKNVFISSSFKVPIWTSFARRHAFP